MNDHVVLESHFPPSPRLAATTSRWKGVSEAAEFIPHRGSLRRIHRSDPPRPRSSSSASDEGSTESGSKLSLQEVPNASLSFYYAIPIVLAPDTSHGSPQGIPRLDQHAHELKFERNEYEFVSRLFSILDTESRGAIGKAPIREFIRLRCPAFRRRDNALVGKKGAQGDIAAAANDRRSSMTFDEVWDAVASCSVTSAAPTDVKTNQDVKIGVEGWMVFCRFIALAQYQEAKRRFSARHLQQTMRHKSGGRGSEVVLVNVPPPDPPAPITAVELEEHERHCKSPIPLPELDLDHCLVSAHDTDTVSRDARPIAGRVEISVFGSGRSTTLFSSSSPTSSVSANDNIEFILTYVPSADESSVVRRSFSDFKWLHDTFTSHKSTGGTLCGRILPPFPAGSGSFSGYDKGAQASGVVVEGGKAAIAVASAGVGMIKSVAKSFLGNSSSSNRHDKKSKSSSGSKLANFGKGIGSTLRTTTRSNEKSVDASSSKAQQLERYLNYLLEHPALSTSFPLNTILKASQSGLDSAKRVLDNSTLHGRHKQLENMTELEKGKQSSYLSSLLPATGLSSSNQPNLSWVRTAAQAAMALKLHGILETTGLPSASAKLQHASLPSFQKTSQDEDVGDDSPSEKVQKAKIDGCVDVDEDAESFEDGVVNVESALYKDGDQSGGSDGYDMLPSPLPLSERSALCAGSIKGGGNVPSTAEDDLVAFDHVDKLDAAATRSSDVPRFHYGSRRIDEVDGTDDNEAVLGDMSVDNDIDRLREIIGSVDNTLGRCLAATTLIREKRRKRDAIHRSIIRGVDAWEGLRGELVSQRALLSGATALEQGSESSEMSLSALNGDLSWQTSLASAAVAAAEDVRCAVRAARTATSAKVAADAAAATAQKICNEGNFPTVNEARAAQTRASIAQSHAIHATVIEHEALAAKRRAAMALAHDVKCWNVHRKQKLLQMCRAVAQTQRNACRQSADAWVHLRDGLIDSSFVSVTDEKRGLEELDFGSSEQVEPIHPVKRAVDECPVIAAMEKSDLRLPIELSDEKGPEEGFKLPCARAEPAEFSMPQMLEPFEQNALTSSISPFESNEEVSPMQQNPPDDAGDISHLAAFLTLSTNSNTEETAQEEEMPQTTERNVGVEVGGALREEELKENSQDVNQDAVEGQGMCESTNEGVRVDNDVLTASMQSLVDGLMTWGEQYDSSQDISLPSGMAVSIALEESEVNPDRK